MSSDRMLPRTTPLSSCCIVISWAPPLREPSTIGAVASRVAVAVVLPGGRGLHWRLAGRLDFLKSVEEDSEGGFEPFGGHGPKPVLGAPRRVDSPIQRIPQLEVPVPRIQLFDLLLPRSEGVELGLERKQELQSGGKRATIR